MSYHSLSSCSTGILGLLVASVWGEFQNFNTRNDIIPPIAADNKHIQISLDTHISSVSRTLPRKAPVAEFYSWRILTVCNWLILTSGPKCTAAADFTSFRKAPVAEFYSWRILTVCNWLILTSRPKCTAAADFTSRGKTHITRLQD